MFMISMTWLEEPTSPGLDASSHGQAGSPSSNGPVDRSRLEEAVRHEDLEGSFSMRTWRDADKQPCPNTEQRRRSLNNFHSPPQTSNMPLRCSGEWRVRKMQQEEQVVWTSGINKEGTAAGGEAKTWQRAKAD